MKKSRKSDLLIALDKSVKTKVVYPPLKDLEYNNRTYQKVVEAYKTATATARSLLSDRLITYLFLVAVDYEDIAFANRLLLDRKIHTFNTDGARIGLGRYYFTLGLLQKAIDYLLPLFEEDKLKSLDLEKLFEATTKLAKFSDADRVMQKALSLYPKSIGWKLIGLRYQISISHLYPKNREFIVNNLKYLYNRCTTADEYLVFAICCYQAGYPTDGRKCLNKALSLVEPGKLAKSNSLEFNPEVCLATMNRLLDLLTTKNINAFPAFGSLLGLYRDGQLMKYDKDADIGIFIDEVENITELIRELCQEGGFAAPMMVTKSPESHRWNVAMIDPITGFAVDIFFFHRNATFFESGVYMPKSAVKWRFEPFNLKPVRLAGKDYLTPENIESHLHSLYGDDWHKPVAVWDSLVNCPNIPAESAPAVGFFGMQRLYKAIRDKKLKKIDNYLNELVNRWPGVLEESVVERVREVKRKIEIEEAENEIDE